jgi:hypothetical protein
MLVHPQAFLDVALREDTGRQVNTPGTGAETVGRDVVEAKAQRLVHVFIVVRCRHMHYVRSPVLHF